MKFTVIIMTWRDSTGSVEFHCKNCTTLEALHKATEQWGYVPPKRFQFWKEKIVMHKFV